MRNPKKQKSRKPRGALVALAVESDLKMPAEILQWELDLLTSVLKAVNEDRDTDSRQPEVPQ